MSGTLVKLVAVVSGSLEYALLGWHASPGPGGLAYGPVSKRFGESAHNIFSS